MCVPTGETDNHEFVDISCSKLDSWGKKKEQRPKNGKEEQEGYHPTLKLSDSKGKRIPTTGEDYRKEVFSNGGRISEKESKRLYLDKRLGIQLLIMNQEFQGGTTGIKVKRSTDHVPVLSRSSGKQMVKMVLQRHCKVLQQQRKFF